MCASPFSCVRPGHPKWPSKTCWNRLAREIEGVLIKVQSPLVSLAASESGSAELFNQLKNPYYLQEDVALTQTLGWVGAWTLAADLLGGSLHSLALGVEAGRVCGFSNFQKASQPFLQSVDGLIHRANHDLS
jgi:hypothetical protein